MIDSKEKLGRAVPQMFERKDKILVTWNNGIKEVDSYKRIWKNKSGFFIKNSIGEPLYIETFEKDMGSWIWVQWKYI